MTLTLTKTEKEDLRDAVSMASQLLRAREQNYLIASTIADAILRPAEGALWRTKAVKLAYAAERIEALAERLSNGAT